MNLKLDPLRIKYPTNNCEVDGGNHPSQIYFMSRIVPKGTSLYRFKHVSHVYFPIYFNASKHISLGSDFIRIKMQQRV